MKKKIKSIFLVIVFFIAGVFLSVILPQEENVLIIDNEFLITFVGLVLGISATIITFIFSSVDKIWEILQEIYTDENELKGMRGNFKFSYNELIEDSSFIFFIFILLVICVVVDNVDIPQISFPEFMPEVKIINAIKVGLFMNCLAAICDLFFSLINILKFVLYENGEKSK